MDDYALQLKEQNNDLQIKLRTLEDQYKPMKERIQTFKMNFGVKEKSDGEITIDYDKFTKALGMEGALELRKVIDETYNVTGDAGKKPHIKLASGA